MSEIKEEVNFNYANMRLAPFRGLIVGFIVDLKNGMLRDEHIISFQTALYKEKEFTI